MKCVTDVTCSQWKPSCKVFWSTKDLRYLEELWAWSILMAICHVSGLCFPLCWGFLSIMSMIMEIMAYLTLWESFMLSESFHWVFWSCSCLHYARWEGGTEVLCCLGNMSYFPAAPYDWSLNCPNLKTLRTPKLDINLYFHSEPFWGIWLKGNLKISVKTKLSLTLLCFCRRWGRFAAETA